MPHSVFVITATEPILPGLVRSLPLGGLPLDDSIRVVADLLDGPLAADDARNLAAVWEDYHGHPDRLAELAGYLRTVGTRNGNVRIPTLEELPLIVPRVVAGLGSSTRRALAVLAAVPEAEWGAELLATLSGTTDNRGASRLAEQMLATSRCGRYRLAAHVYDHLPAGFPAPVAEIAVRLTVWLHETARPAAVAQEAEVIERTLDAALTGGHYLAALVLAKAASIVIMNSADWPAWRRILHQGLRAARAVDSVTGELYYSYGLVAWRRLTGLPTRPSNCWI